MANLRNITTPTQKHSATCCRYQTRLRPQRKRSNKGCGQGLGQTASEDGIISVVDLASALGGVGEVETEVAGGVGEGKVDVAVDEATNACPPSYPIFPNDSHRDPRLLLLPKVPNTLKINDACAF